MPKIYEYFGIVFYLHTRDEHTPIHVHARKGNRMSIIEIVLDGANKKILMVRRKRVAKGSEVKELKLKELNQAVKFVNIKAEEIVAAWRLVFDGKFKQKPVVITRRIV